MYKISRRGRAGQPGGISPDAAGVAQLVERRSARPEARGQSPPPALSSSAIEARSTGRAVISLVFSEVG